MKGTATRLFHGPETRLGTWSVGLIIAMFSLFFLGTSFTSVLYASVPAGNSILEDVAARPALALTMLAGMAAGVLAFVIGIVAVAAKKERSLFVYISTLIGLLLAIFLVGEFISPH